MNEHIQVRQSQQRRASGPIVLMIAGIIFLAASIFILATGIGTSHGLGGSYISTPGYSSGSVPEPLLALGALSIPSIPIGVMLFLIGLVTTIKKSSLRWLRITVSILCGIVLGLAVLWFLLVSALLLIGF